MKVEGEVGEDIRRKCKINKASGGIWRREGQRWGGCEWKRGGKAVEGNGRNGEGEPQCR